MNTELSDAYYGVYSSSKEILKNNQRHLFCNMLDLLANTCKTTGIACNKISDDDQVSFWISNILPLMFDEDLSIQTSAASALEQGLVSLDVKTIHGSSNWSEMKNNIIMNLAPRINKLREEKNSLWYRIWCLLIKILDKEILKGASTINSFLSIVELGFRSPDNKIRAEAFHCWRLLITIFAIHNEISSPKRMKLICIPLKSSQSKSAHAAEVKLRVWWYLFSCLGSQIEQYFDNVVGPFLVFTFGLASRNVNAAVLQYPSIREIALACFVALTATEKNCFLDRIFKDNDLEKITLPSILARESVLKKHWLTIVTSNFEAINLLNKVDTPLTDVEQQLLHLLVKYMAILFVRCDIFQYRMSICKQLMALPTDSTRTLVTFFNTFASEGHAMKMSTDNIDEYIDNLKMITDLFCSSKCAIPPAILQRCIDHVFKLPQFGSGASQWRKVSKILEIVILTDDDLDYGSFETKLMIWRRFSYQLINYIKDNSLDYRIKEYATNLNNWILWPIKVSNSFAGRRSNVCFDNSFSEIWRQLVLCGQNSFERNKFLHDIKLILSETLMSSRKDEICFPELYDIYVAAVMKYGLNKDSKLKDDIIGLLEDVLKAQLPSKTKEGFLNTFRNIVVALSNSEFEDFFESLKMVVKEVIKIAEKGEIGVQYFEEWKRSLMEKSKTHLNKMFASQLRELYKGNDVFVIIPSVWSLNPEKLTERQKERFAEKADIPALYNDMSQSQDSSIKPWTPKKIVIAKENQKEISIGNSEVELDKASENFSGMSEIVSSPQKKTSPTKKANVFKKPVKTPVHSTSAESKEYNFRRTRSSLTDDSGKKENDEESDANSTNSETIALRTRRSAIKSKLSEDVHDKNKNLTKSPTKQNNFAASKQTLPNSEDAVVEMEMQSDTVHTSQLQKPCTVQETNSGNVEIPETPLIDSNLNKGDLIDSEQLNDELHKVSQMMEIREVSPKKTIPQRFTPLSSPPDRRQTNNSSSPTLRPKPSAHLTGRGAQLINMIRNKKIDTHSPAVKPNSSKDQLLTKDDKKHENNPVVDLIELTGTENTSTPIQSKDLLIFSKRLPSPTASPSASILKRKLRRDSLDDISIESPALKRKRVSFHDPPVSVTKEYIKDCEENKAKPKRCLILEKQQQQQQQQQPVQILQNLEAKHVLKRRSKLDSIIEIEKYEVQHQQSSSNTSLDKISHKNADDSMSSLKWNDSRSSTPNEKPECDPVSLQNVSSCSNFAQMDVDAAMSLVVQQCSVENVLEKFFSVDKGQSVKFANVVAKFISNQMNTTPKIKTTVLEILSENHSKDFLDHAVQENLSSVVCDRLNLNSVIDYVCAKSKINASCRSNLLSQMPEILKNSKIESEKFNFIKNILSSCLLSDENILEIISLLMELRSKTTSIETGCVSESAVDSSSNL